MLYRDKYAKYLAVYALILLFFGGCGGYKSGYAVPPGKINRSPAMYKATMRPYTVRGIRYYPTVVKVGTTYKGTASWYGYDFHGNSTSNGEFYNMYAYTAAHKTLPMNTILKVTNLKNGKSVIVRVNDRGPFAANRIIDLSYAAAKKIDMIRDGTAPVKITVLGFNGKITPKGKIVPQKEIKKVTLKNFAVQIGSFRNIEGAYRYKEKYDRYLNRYYAIIKKFIYNNKPVFKVWLKGFRSEKEARDFIASNHIPGAFIVRE